MSCSNIRTPSKVAQKITNEVRSEEKEEECFTPRGQKHQSRDGGWRHQKVLTYSRRRFTWNIFCYDPRADSLSLSLSRDLDGFLLAKTLCNKFVNLSFYNTHLSYVYLGSAAALQYNIKLYRSAVFFSSHFKQVSVNNIQLNSWYSFFYV